MGWGEGVKVERMGGPSLGDFWLQGGRWRAVPLWVLVGISWKHLATWPGSRGSRGSHLAGWVLGPCWRGGMGALAGSGGASGVGRSGNN